MFMDYSSHTRENRDVQKAFAYLGVSGKGQVDGDGFTRQVAAIRTYAAKNTIKIILVFRETDVSGTKELENRPALVALMTAPHSNGVKLVLVERLDRLARDLVVHGTISGDLRKNGFEPVSVGEPDLLQNDPSRKLMRQIFGASSEYEKTMIVLKLRGARARQKAKTGRCEGAKPYSEFPGLDRVAAALHAEGIKPRRGARWHGLTVNKILTGKGRKAGA
jgi:DNA invertase Pin-like site-specific DNA recombinase